MEYFERHPTLDILELYLLDQLQTNENRDMAKHLSACDACQQMSVRLREQIDLIREAMSAA